MYSYTIFILQCTHTLSLYYNVLMHYPYTTMYSYTIVILQCTHTLSLYYNVLIHYPCTTMYSYIILILQCTKCRNTIKSTDCHIVVLPSSPYSYRLHRQSSRNICLHYYMGCLNSSSLQ